MASVYDDDDFSDDSFDDESSVASQKDEPPTLDDALYDDTLYAMFSNYMKSQQAYGSFKFLWDARNFRMMNQPHEVVVVRASKIIMLYFSAASPFPVPLPEELNNQILEYALDPNAELQIDLNIFSVAFGDVYNAVMPRFRNWLSTNEWREAIPFHRLAPPSFNIVLTTSKLRLLFNKFIKAQLESDTDGSVSRAYHLWKFCLIANDFRDGKYTHESHLESRRKKHMSECGSTDGASEASKDEEAGGEKKMKPEEYAKRLYKKYKHYISLPYDDTMPYAVFVVRALDRIIEDFDKSTLYGRWIALKQYLGNDFQAKTVHQSLTPEGYAEPPTLAAAITSSILPVFMGAVQGSEQGMNLEFLTEILAFHRKFSMFETTSKGTSSNATSSSQDSSSASKKTKGEMIDEAKRIFAKFLDKTEMYCDPGLVEEVRALINKGNGKGVHPAMFRKCGAFIYHRSEHTWCREARATFGWVGRSYDNRSKNSRAVEEEFSMKLLPAGFDLQFVPSLDDILETPALAKDYVAYADEQSDKAFGQFYAIFTQYFKTPIHERKPLLKKLLGVFAEVVGKFPELAAVNGMLCKEVERRERLTDTIIHALAYYVARTSASHFYSDWLVEHSMVWKSAEWSPVPAIRFSDLRMLVGLNAVQSRIEEAALKGKSGFSRYLAKRQVNKQKISNVRTGRASELKKGGSVILSTGMVDLGYAESGSKDDNPLTVPSLRDTLSSSYLRDLFGKLCLEICLTTADFTLWEALCAFYKKYESIDNEKLIESQDEMRKEALVICDKFKALIRNSSEVQERIKNLKIIFPNVFRSVEEELYSKHHADYEEILRKKGWK